MPWRKSNSRSYSEKVYAKKQVKKGMHVIEATVRDATGKMTATWFNLGLFIPCTYAWVKGVVKGKV